MRDLCHEVCGDALREVPPRKRGGRKQKLRGKSVAVDLDLSVEAFEPGDVARVFERDATNRVEQVGKLMEQAEHLACMGRRVIDHHDRKRRVVEAETGNARLLERPLENEDPYFLDADAPFFE